MNDNEVSNGLKAPCTEKKSKCIILNKINARFLKIKIQMLVGTKCLRSHGTKAPCKNS